MNHCPARNNYYYTVAVTSISGLYLLLVSGCQIPPQAERAPSAPVSISEDVAANSPDHPRVPSDDVNNLTMEESKIDPSTIRNFGIGITNLTRQPDSQTATLTLSAAAFQHHPVAPAHQLDHALDTLSAWLKQRHERLVLVDASITSAGGDQGYLDGLAQRYAESLRLALIQRGISSRRILARGHGRSGQNRQVNVVLSVLRAGQQLP